MTDEPDATSAGWFSAFSPGDLQAASAAITEGHADQPEAWPRLAVESSVADSEDAYYDLLHEATITATREAVRERERADDQQLVHAIRAMDDCDRVANELAERVSEWAGSLGIDATGVDGAREIAARVPESGEEQLTALAQQVTDVADEADDLRAYIESRAPGVAPNLAAMAGPILAARLIALAGGLERLAKMPSGTVQVLGAEDALFAHLRGHGSSPKHGIIFTHDYVRGTSPDERGSAARALAGKLTIAARVDHYSGDRRPELDEELDDRIRQIRTRGDNE